MTPLQSIRTRSLWIALLLAFSVAAFGGWLTRIDAWYEALLKSAFQPPDWAFGPAWTTIFALCAYSAHRLWEASVDADQRRQLLILFGFNAILNVGWSFLFFFMQRPDWALFEIFVLWLSIAMIIVQAGGRAPIARWTLAPYLAWVSFAITLNYAVTQLNGPFD